MQAALAFGANGALGGAMAGGWASAAGAGTGLAS